MQSLLAIDGCSLMRPPVWAVARDTKRVGIEFWNIAISYRGFLFVCAFKGAPYGQGLQ